MKIGNTSEMSGCRANRSEIWDLGVVSGVYVQLLEFWPSGTFIPRYGNFDNWSVFRKLVPVMQK